jgi:phosphohistidine phosphatase
MRLYLVRHAEAAPGEPDELRALTDAGRAAARELGERLSEDGVRPDAVLTSPLLRARETGEAIARATGAETVADERLEPGATAASVLAAAAGRGETVVVVGHQPDCGLITTALTGDVRSFPPAAVAVIDLPG